MKDTKVKGHSATYLAIVLSTKLNFMSPRIAKTEYILQMPYLYLDQWKQVFQIENKIKCNYSVFQHVLLQS